MWKITFKRQEEQVIEPPLLFLKASAFNVFSYLTKVIFLVS